MLDAIVPMKQGELPTEPGFYVVSWWGRPHVVEDVQEHRNGGLVFSAEAHRRDVHPECGAEFIARVYPERITRETRFAIVASPAS